MKKLNLDIPLMLASGEVVKDNLGRNITIKDSVSNMISQAKSENPIRMWDLALKLYKSKKTVEIEDADYKEVVKIIKENKTATNLVVGQILKALETDV